MHGRDASAAIDATPYGTLPERLEKSKAPSPVITRSACLARASSPSAAATRSNPGRRSAPRRSSAKPSPPAAPAPFSSAVRRPVAAANASRSPSTAGSRSSGMPFWGPNVLVAPNRPVKGLSTSLAQTRETPASRS